MFMQNITNMKVNAKRCSTCPFNEDGCIEIRNVVMQRIMELQTSQLCHHTDNTTLCRGARNWQKQIFYRLGFLDDESDKTWNRKLSQIQHNRNHS